MYFRFTTYIVPMSPLDRFFLDIRNAPYLFQVNAPYLFQVLAPYTNECNLSSHRAVPGSFYFPQVAGRSFSNAIGWRQARASLSKSGKIIYLFIAVVGFLRLNGNRKPQTKCLRETF